MEFVSTILENERGRSDGRSYGRATEGATGDRQA